MRWTLIACLIVVYALVLFAVLHPRISEAYRAYFIDHTSLDWNRPHYRATPEEGMAFNQAGLPDWVASTYGFSHPEPWGQWTDDDLGNVAGLVLSQPMSGTFCIEFNASPAQPVHDSFAVRFGNQVENISWSSRDAANYQAQFTDVREARRLEFILPKNLPRVHDYDPSNGDRRRLGMSLRTLKIRTGNCTSAQ